VCYTEVKALAQEKTPFDVCIHCDMLYCADCIEDWTVQTIKGTYIRDFESVDVKCPSQNCRRKLTIDELIMYPQFMDSERQERILDALTLKYVQASDTFIACPNDQCKNYGFVNDVCCYEDMKCNACSHQWRLPSQKSFFSWIFSNMNVVGDANFKSNLYKILFS